MNNKVTVSEVNQVETPSSQIISENNAEYKVVDSQGREIMIKRPTLVDQYKFVAALGDELSSNKTFCAMCNPLRFVTSIGGFPVSKPTRVNEIYALIDRIGENGLVAIVDGIVEHFSDETKEEAKDTLKKG